MSIRIKNINVKNLGPIPELSLQLGSINLFYGNNEKGKSYLVEFIIRSLFKTSGWSLRENAGTGKIILEGLLDGARPFDPDSNKKLVDYLTEKYSGLPPDFCKLLVIEGTSVKLGKESESDREMLRRFLSHKHILNKIKNNFLPTVRDCSISGFTIEGARRGKLKTRTELQSKIKRIEKLYTVLEDKFFGGKLNNLKNQLKKVLEQYEKLEKAKKYKAYQVKQQIKELDREIEKIDNEKVNELLQEIRDLDKNEQNIKSKKGELEELEETTKHYEWLQEAIDEYKEYNLGEVTEKPSGWILYTIIALFVITAFFTATGMKWIGLGGMAVLLITGYIYKREYDKYFKDSYKRDELKNIESDFQNRFNESLDNLAVMEGKLGLMEDNYKKRSFLKENIEELKKTIRDSKLELENKISNYFGEEIGRNNWRQKLKEELDRKENLKSQKNDLRIELDRLNVPKDDFITEEPEEQFSHDIFNEIDKRKKEIEDKIRKKEEELAQLKQTICVHTDDDISRDWIELISNLSKLREEKIKDYKDITSDIMAGKYVTDVLNNLIDEEDEKIHDALESEVIKDTLLKVTTHYDDIILKDDRLIVSDKFNSFPVSTISDGAQEQVFLALRIALAKEWFKKEELFLILDDAFIHSDKKRTPQLIDRTIQLSKEGWQILCFTFDDRIKNIFEEKTKDHYKLIDLNKLN